MSIYDFVNLINDCECIVFTVFDCNTSNVVSIATDDGEKYDLNVDELLGSDISDYEIGGTDMWYDDKKKCIRIEFNIDLDEEEDE